MPKKRTKRRDWYEIVERFSKTKQKRKRIEMSGAKVAQVQAWRLRKLCPKLDISTQDKLIILAKR